MCYSPELEEALTAKAWGISIEEWYSKPRWARATMIAANRAAGIIEHEAIHAGDKD